MMLKEFYGLRGQSLLFFLFVSFLFGKFGVLIPIVSFLCFSFVLTALWGGLAVFFFYHR